MYHGGPQTRWLHTALCKFVQNVSTNISSVRERTDLKHEKVSSLLIFFFLLYAMNGFPIIFSLRDSATQEYGILVHGVLCLFSRTKRRFSSIVMWSTLMVI